MAIIHFNRRSLARGDIIEAGNFGRLLRELHPGMPGADGRVYVLGMLAREYIFELVRRDLNPSAPSRLTGVFACPTERDAEQYAAENNKDGHMCAYEVEPVDPTSATHVAALSHCIMISGVSFIDLMEPKARLYWTGAPGDPANGWEIIFECSLRVFRAL